MERPRPVSSQAWGIVTEILFIIDLGWCFQRWAITARTRVRETSHRVLSYSHIDRLVIHDKRGALIVNFRVHQKNLQISEIYHDSLSSKTL